MISQEMFKWHIRSFKLCGLWPPQGGSKLYSVYVILFSIAFNIIFPITEIVCVFFVDSVEQVVDHMILRITIILIVIKSFIVLATKNRFAEILNIMKELDESVTTDESQEIFLPILKRSNFMISFYFYDYVICYIISLLQVIVSPPEQRIWSSTYLYPIELLHHPAIYLGVIVFQGIAHFEQVTICPALDTYGAALMDAVSGHVQVLSHRLSALGNSDTDTDTSNPHNHQAELIKLCKKYNSILR